MIYNPSEIEEELLRVQRNVSPAEARTSLYNLVIFATDATRSYADRAVGHLLGRRPARIVQVRPAHGDESDIRVSARCLLDSNHQSVCIQEVVIDAAGKAAAPGLWAPVLIRDIPVYALWLDTVTDHIDDLLLAWEQADGIIVDSELGTDEEAARVFRSLLNAHESQNLLFSDLAWRRLTPFREAVATLFDTNDAVAELQEISRVVVINLPATSGLLFTSWLAARLGWLVQDGREYRDAAGRTVTVETDRSTEDMAAAEARFETFDGRELSARADGLGCVQLDRGDGSRETRVYAVPTLGESLMNELDDTKIDEVYLETVALLAR